MQNIIKKVREVNFSIKKENTRVFIWFIMDKVKVKLEKKL